MNSSARGGASYRNPRLQELLMPPKELYAEAGILRIYSGFP